MQAQAVQHRDLVFAVAEDDVFQLDFPPNGFGQQAASVLFHPIFREKLMDTVQAVKPLGNLRRCIQSPLNAGDQHVKQRQEQDHGTDVDIVL